MHHPAILPQPQCTTDNEQNKWWNDHHNRIT